ncbi:MAG: hypothetical protein AB7S70_09410 [Hyphomicrobium sp.]|uniref:hypothetical protein n=1 Tax=Hyphomicrobium sp. TaxID=82 RepID=UPI003D114010
MTSVVRTAALIDIGSVGTMLLLVVVAAAIVLLVVARFAGKRTAAPKEEDAPAVPLPLEKAPPVDWPARIAAAEAAGDKAALARHYLAFARDEIARGESRVAAEHLRASVGVAARNKDAVVHAEARLELAELARAEGDLTTACEHWQIARALFFELKEQPSLGETERLMQKHGCPTDWVLNDF